MTNTIAKFVLSDHILSDSQLKQRLTEQLSNYEKQHKKWLLRVKHTRFKKYGKYILPILITTIRNTKRDLANLQQKGITITKSGRISCSPKYFHAG